MWAAKGGRYLVTVKVSQEPRPQWFPTHQEIEIVENATSQDVFLQAHRRHHQLHRQFDFELKLLLFMCAFEYLCVYVVT